MKDVHMVVGIAAIAITTVAAVSGLWCWWRSRSSPWFWRVLRVSQVVVIVEVILGGILVATGKKPPTLHVIYGLLPLAVAFIAEQLRIAAAQMVLDSRGFESAHQVGRLPDEEQQVVVLAIVRRELGVMALAAVVTVVLLARAAGTA